VSGSCKSERQRQRCPRDELVHIQFSLGTGYVSYLSPIGTVRSELDPSDA
jgi:hypothetical protein